MKRTMGARKSDTRRTVGSHPQQHWIDSSDGPGQFCLHVLPILPCASQPPHHPCQHPLWLLRASLGSQYSTLQKLASGERSFRCQTTRETTTHLGFTQTRDFSMSFRARSAQPAGVFGRSPLSSALRVSRADERRSVGGAKKVVSRVLMKSQRHPSGPVEGVRARSRRASVSLSRMSQYHQ